MWLYQNYISISSKFISILTKNSNIITPCFIWSVKYAQLISPYKTNIIYNYNNIVFFQLCVDGRIIRWVWYIFLQYNDFCVNLNHLAVNSTEEKAYKNTYLWLILRERQESKLLDELRLKYRTFHCILFDTNSVRQCKQLCLYICTSHTLPSYLLIQHFSINAPSWHNPNQIYTLWRLPIVPCNLQL